ncbi:MAG: GFA family protein [Pseudomonadota bacterium]
MTSEADLAPGRYSATCHCGAVELELNLPKGLDTPRRCTCSFCSRRGAIAVTVPLGDLRVVKGGTLKLDTFNTGVAQHYFCSTCGIYTHHQRRSNPNEYGVNAANIEGVAVWTLDPVAWNDGVNHPSDRNN